MKQWTEKRIMQVAKCARKYLEYESKAQAQVDKIDKILAETESDFRAQRVDSDAIIYLYPREICSGGCVGESYTLDEVLTDWGAEHRKDVSKLIAFYECICQQFGWAF